MKKQTYTFIPDLWALKNVLLDDLISGWFLARNPRASERYEKTTHWRFLRCERKIVVELSMKSDIPGGFPITVGLGWAECSKTDKWSTEIGLRIALARALKG
jgi:hypothetical protein